MNVYDFLAKLKNDEFTVNCNGHEFYGNIVSALIEKVEWYIQYHKDNINIEYNKKSLESFAKDDAIPVGSMWFTVPNKDYHCKKCGKRLEVYLENETTLSLGVFENKNDTKNINYKNDICVFADGIKPHKTQINITSGKLVIVNYFNKFEDAPEELKYTSDWSLNFQLGRNTIANYLASQNVAYQQTSNMSVHFWKHKVKNKIVVTDSSFEDEECVDGDRYSNFVKEYQYIGDISCGVWRWMATDMENISKELLTEDDYLTVDLEAGKYELTDYYNSDDYDDFIMATFELKE